MIGSAALLARWDTQTGGTDSERIASLSFGTQLRPYIGRFFPELLGPAVLGTSGTRGARAWAADPWEREASVVDCPAAGAWTLSGSLAGDGGTGPVRWRSLWRRTDHLGFPVSRYTRSAEDRDIDRTDSEWDDDVCPPKVVTHGGDQRTPQYREQLDALVRRRGPTPPLDRRRRRRPRGLRAHR